MAEQSPNPTPPSTQAFTWDRFGLGPLPRLVRLTSLKFDEDALGHDNVASLACSLGRLTDLKSLELPHFYYQSTGQQSDISVLSSSLSGLVSLEHLVMGSVGLSAQDMNRMLSSLTALQRLDLCCCTSDIAPVLSALTHLDLSNNRLWEAEGGMASISHSLNLLTGLLYLDLGHYEGFVRTRCDAAAAATLGHGLPCSLTYLSLAHTGYFLGAEAILSLASGLHHLTTLKLLDLSGNIYEDVDSLEARTGCERALADCIEHMPGLTSLDLWSNCLGPDCVPALARSLKRLRNLHDLNLGCNLLGAGARLLIDCLQNLQELQVLDLSENELGVSGAQQLAVCLPRMPKLRDLDLGSNRFGDDGFVALTGCLVSLPSLTRIDVGSNELTEVAVEALATALRATGRLKAMPALVYFGMGHNKLGDRSAQALAGCLEHMPHLKSLVLEKIELHDNGVASLLTVMQKLDSLTFLDVSGNGLTNVTVNIIMAAMERPDRDICY